MSQNSDSDDWAFVPRRSSSGSPDSNQEWLADGLPRGSNTTVIHHDKSDFDSNESIKIETDSDDTCSATPDDIELIDNDELLLTGEAQIIDHDHPISLSQLNRSSSAAEQEELLSTTSTKQLFDSNSTPAATDGEDGSVAQSIRTLPSSESIIDESVNSRGDTSDFDSDIEEELADSDVSVEENPRPQSQVLNVRSVFERLDRLNTCIELFLKLRAYIQYRNPAMSVGTAVVFLTALGIGIGNMNRPRENTNLTGNNDVFELNLNQRQLFNLRRLQHDLVDCAKRRERGNQEFRSSKVCTGHERFWRSRFDAISNEHGVDIRKILLKAKQMFRAKIDLQLKETNGLSLSLLDSQQEYLDRFERERSERHLRQTVDHLREENHELYARLRKPRDSDHHQLIIANEIRVSRLERENAALKDKLSKKTGSVYIQQQSNLEDTEKKNDVLRAFVNLVSSRLENASPGQIVKLSERDGNSDINLMHHQLSIIEGNLIDVLTELDHLRLAMEPRNREFNSSVKTEINQVPATSINVTNECDRKLKNCMATSLWMQSNVEYWKQQYSSVSNKSDKSHDRKNDDVSVEHNGHTMYESHITDKENRENIVKEGDFVELLAFVVASATEKSQTFAKIVNELRSSLHRIHDDQHHGETMHHNEPIIYQPGHDQSRMPQNHENNYFDSISADDSVQPIIDEPSSLLTGLVKLLTAHVNVDELDKLSQDSRSEANLSYSDSEDDNGSNDYLENMTEPMEGSQEKQRRDMIKTLLMSTVDESTADHEKCCSQQPAPFNLPFPTNFDQSPSSIISTEFDCKSHSSCLLQAPKRSMLALKRGDLAQNDPRHLDRSHHVQNSHRFTQESPSEPRVRSDRWIGANSLQVQEITRTLVETAVRMIAGPDEDWNHGRDNKISGRNKAGKQHSWLFERARQRKRLRKMSIAMKDVLTDWLFRRAQSRESQRRKPYYPQKPNESKYHKSLKNFHHKNRNTSKTYHKNGIYQSQRNGQKYL